MPSDAMAGCTPEAALRHGGWRKLICGASNQDLAAITDLAWVYTPRRHPLHRRGP